jgi:hypothetical protein
MVLVRRVTLMGFFPFHFIAGRSDELFPLYSMLLVSTPVGMVPDYIVR